MHHSCDVAVGVSGVVHSLLDSENFHCTWRKLYTYDRLKNHGKWGDSPKKKEKETSLFGENSIIPNRHDFLSYVEHKHF